MAYCARFVDLPAKLGRLIFHVQACVASVSLQFQSKEKTLEKWFRSKERGKRVNDRAKDGAS